MSKGNIIRMVCGICAVAAYCTMLHGAYYGTVAKHPTEFYSLLFVATAASFMVMTFPGWD